MKKEKYIRERDGVYTVEISGTDNGRRWRQYVGSFNPADYGGKSSLALRAAKAARDHALVEAEKGRYEAKKETVDDLFTVSLSRLQSLKTAERHAQMYRALVPEDLRAKRIEKVTLAEIQGTVDAFALTHSQDALDRTPTIWRQIYREAMRAEIYVPDRSAAIVVPKSKKPAQRRAKYVSADDLEDFLSVLLTYNAGSVVGLAVALDLWVMIRTMQFCGLRPQEALGLSCDDIDLTGSFIHVRHSVGSTALKKAQIIPLKTEQSRRDVPIPAALLPILRDHVALREGEGLLFRDPETAEPYEIDRLSGIMARASKKAGIKVTLYMLRHVFATDLAKVTSPKTLQALMGHETAVMSLRYADQPDAAELAAAMAKRRFS